MMDDDDDGTLWKPGKNQNTQLQTTMCNLQTYALPRLQFDKLYKTSFAWITDSVGSIPIPYTKVRTL
jgi:hypothetical protein